MSSAQPGPADTSKPDASDALLALVRVLARQAAREALSAASERKPAEEVAAERTNRGEPNG